MSKLTKEELNKVPVGEIFTSTIAELVEFTGDIGRYEEEGFGWADPHTFFKIIEVNNAAKTVTSRRLK